MKNCPWGELTDGVYFAPLMPMPLYGLDQICATFGKRHETVQEWHRAKAPIWFNGTSYICEFNTLLSWVIKHRNQIAVHRGSSARRDSAETLDTKKYEK